MNYNLSRRTSDETIYDYYQQRYQSQAAKSDWSGRIAQTEEKYFDMNYIAAKNSLLERGYKRPSYTQIVNELVSHQVFAYKRSSAIKQAKFINEQNPDEKISYKDIQMGKVSVDKAELSRIYQEKIKEYQKLFPNGSYHEAVKYAKEYISWTIYGSK